MKFLIDIDNTQITPGLTTEEFIQEVKSEVEDFCDDCGFELKSVEAVKE